MHLKRAVTIFLAAFAFLQAEDSLPDVKFVPLNSLTEAAENQATEPASNSATSASYTAEALPQEDSAQTPYGLPRELMPLWDSLTIKQKAAQMVMVYMTPASFMLEHEFGGYLVMKNHLKNLDKFTENIKIVNDSMRIKPLVAADQEGGLVNRISVVAPRWEHTPSAKQMRNMSEDSIRTLAKEIGAVLDSVGINLNLAPVLDPAKDSRGKHSFMEESKRSWGEDTTNATKVRAFVQGMRESNVACVSKHFPGYDSWTNSDHQIAVSSTPKAKVAKNVEFFKTLSSDIPVTMMSSVSFVRISSRPAVFEPKIVKMARDMSPETVILTDDLWGVSLRAWVSGNERVRSKNYPAKDFRKLVRTALMAGNDMFMITYPQKAVEMVNYLAALSKQSKYYRQRIEESAARILKMKFKAGIIK
ncbi:glycoside hydrolase family 3 N-terminal domain-containing protein [Fibrobacter sp.]|uniref:glycoside hydrolase family 3 N-terminal domain-containing protein n=1 Tax=Fibrobacter sp. TaxID=35828 RepID=UPI00389036BE